MLKCVIVPIVKNKNKRISDKDNYIHNAYLMYLQKWLTKLSVTRRHCSVHKARTAGHSLMCMFDKRQFDYNSLLFTPFLTVYFDSRLRVNVRLVYKKQ